MSPLRYYIRAHPWLISNFVANLSFPSIDHDQDHDHDKFQHHEPLAFLTSPYPW